MCIKFLYYGTETYLRYNVKMDKNRLKHTCELYITNWSHSKKSGIVFAMYQRMILKGDSWDEPRHTRYSVRPPIFFYSVYTWYKLYRRSKIDLCLSGLTGLDRTSIHSKHYFVGGGGVV